MTPNKWSDLDEYLKASHLKGKTVPATVERIEFRELHPRGKPEIKPVMFFVGKQKGLILTSTNQKFLRSDFGDDIRASYGAKVTLTPVTKTIAGREIQTIVLNHGKED